MLILIQIAHRYHTHISSIHDGARCKLAQCSVSFWLTIFLLFKISQYKKLILIMISSYLSEHTHIHKHTGRHDEGMQHDAYVLRFICFWYSIKSSGMESVQNTRRKKVTLNRDVHAFNLKLTVHWTITIPILYFYI